jgi:hypothetical protein
LQLLFKGKVARVSQEEHCHITIEKQTKAMYKARRPSGSQSIHSQYCTYRFLTQMSSPSLLLIQVSSNQVPCQVHNADLYCHQRFLRRLRLDVRG